MSALPLFFTLLSSGLYVLSFPPFSFTLLAWVALAPFFLAATMTRPRSAALYGGLWGVAVMHGVGWWFPQVVANYFQVSFAVGWIGLLAVSIFLIGSSVAGFAAWLSWSTRQQAVGPMLVAFGWGTCEFTRATFLSSNWIALSGYSQMAFTRLVQIADIAGPYGVGILLAWGNAYAAGFFAPRLCRRPLRSGLGIGAMIIATLLYGQWRLSQIFAVGDPLPIAVIQGAIDEQLRWKPEYIQANLDRYLSLTRTIAEAHPTLIFWPEYAIDFHLQLESRQREAIFQMTRDLGADLLVGGRYYGYGESAMFFRNSVFLVHQGALAGRYDKVHLIPFAENNPLEFLLPQIRDQYEPGQRGRLLSTATARIGAFICFESVYPDFVREFVRQGAEVLANPSNDAWLGSAAPARHQLDIASMRAIENRRYLVRPTTTGISAVIDPYGRIVTASDYGVPAVLTATIFRSHAHTLYQRWGDAVTWIAVVWTLVCSLTRLKKSKENVR
ncbi:MAG: apolipoprotein N-acyltransferase [Deltaproteobacteria bacterium]|nr:apolipoprotein N-acyltransferase [Deltaproteobacteria bacterium]